MQVDDFLCRLGRRGHAREVGGDAELIERVNQDNDVVAQDLGQNLVHLGRIALGLDTGAELPLDNRHRGFDVAALVVMGGELVAVEAEVVVHLGPYAVVPGRVARARFGGGLKRNERRRADRLDLSKVALAGVSLVCRYLFDVEGLSGPLQQVR